MPIKIIKHIFGYTHVNNNIEIIIYTYKLYEAYTIIPINNNLI